MLRYLRITVSVISLVACMLLIALWLRSYWWIDVIYGDANVSYSLNLTCEYGRLQFYATNHTFDRPFRHTSWRLSDDQIDSIREWSSWQCRKEAVYDPSARVDGWDKTHSPFYITWVLSVPHWFPVLLTGMLAAALGIRRPFQYSLRTLLIAMTITAAWLGLIVWLT